MMDGWLGALQDAFLYIHDQKLDLSPALATISTLRSAGVGIRCKHAVALGYELLSLETTPFWVGDVFMAHEQEIGIVNYYALATSLEQDATAMVMICAYMHISTEFIAKRKEKANTGINRLMEKFPVLASTLQGINRGGSSKVAEESAVV